MVHLPDILFVTTDEIDHRNKLVYLNDNLQCTLMNCTLNKLLKLAPQLIQVNKSELISLRIIKNVEFDVLTLHNFNQNKQEKQITLGHLYRKNFIRLLLK